MVHNKGLPEWVEIIVKYENIWRHSHYCEWKHTSKDGHSLDCGFSMLSHTSEWVMEHYGQLFTDMIWSGSCVLFLFRRQADNLLLYCFTAVFAVSCRTAFPFWMPRVLNDHFLCGTKKQLQINKNINRILITMCPPTEPMCHGRLCPPNS